MNSDNPYVTDLRRALYPNGIKHPQQGEWHWMIEEVMRLRANQAPVYSTFGELVKEGKA